MSNIEKFFDSIKVYDCGHKRRIGNEADGGYVVLSRVCLSSRLLWGIGVEDNVSFEKDWKEKYDHTWINLYDHTVDGLPEEIDDAIFFKKGIGVKTIGDMFGLGDLLDKLPEHEGITLKMDIEWDEWKVLDSLTPEQFNKIDQLLIELHIVGIDTKYKDMMKNPPTPYFSSFYEFIFEKMNEDIFELYYRVMMKLNEHFYAFHIHPNNSLQKVQLNEYEFPPLLEMGFVNKAVVDKLGLEPTPANPEDFPVPGIDFPNKPWRDDIIDYYPIRRK